MDREIAFTIINAECCAENTVLTTVLTSTTTLRLDTGRFEDISTGLIVL